MAEEFDVIRLFDPAILWVGPNATNLAKFAKSRDRADLTFVPGKEPVVYRCRRLRRSRMLLVDESVSMAAAEDRAFAHGVLEIRVPGRAPAKPAGDSWTAEEMELLEWADIREVGSVVMARSRVPFDSSPRYPVLRSSLDVWDAAVSLCAEPSQGSASPRPSAPEGPSDRPPPSSERSDTSSASPTAATAPDPSPEAQTKAA